ncbi:tetrahydrofolate dehydrogenase/cyclohydrolase catalytic domain-containing protein [Streptomyces mutabilis]|uniref:tetrahydrofolate dehydrogenase/cyclohydrolase catalytic domain-containing protein n=1 Tax=Streptomyces mutabilis TaxID=67332 RepID=UPI00364637F9
MPGLATILVGDDPASAVYVAAKRRAIREAGMRDFHHHLPQHATHEAVEAVIDGLTITSVGRLARDERGLRPCTPSGVIKLLDAEEFERQGARVVVVDWGELVGSSPLMHLLQCRGATVTVAHECTTDLSAIARTADRLESTAHMANSWQVSQATQARRLSLSCLHHQDEPWPKCASQRGVEVRPGLRAERPERAARPSPWRRTPSGIVRSPLVSA